MLRALLAVLLLLALPALAVAAPGDLDPSFGSGGAVAFTTPGNTAVGDSLVVLPDGRLLIAGTVSTPGGSNFLLARLASDGSLDSTFGVGGLVTTDIGADDEGVRDVLRQPDGAIVVLGAATLGGDRRMVLARYDADGVLDLGFGTGGIASVDFPGGTFEDATAVGRQSDGSLIAVGYAVGTTTLDFALARFDAGGTLDATFGTGGIVTTDFSGRDDRGQAVVVQPDDGIVVAGSADFGGGNDSNLALARYTPNGALDPTFGGSGLVVTDDGGSTNDAAHAVLRQPDGAYVIAGTSAFMGSFTLMVLARYDASGTLDATFGSDGVATHGLFVGYGASASGILRTPDGALVVVGARFQPTEFRSLVTRWTADGVLDAGFGNGGVVSGDYGALYDVGQQSDAKLVVTGLSTTSAGNNYRVGVTRLLGGLCGNGTPEPDEICDDGNLTSGDGCDADCTPTGCGNGIVTPGETCDDGNVAAGDCCSATCQLDAPGSACTDDGNLCSNDACDGDGTCLHAIAPAPVCAQPLVAGKTTVALKTGTTPKLSWQWRQGPAVSTSDFGDPAVDTDYTICVYDSAGGVPSLALAEHVPGGALCGGQPCWRTTAKGFAYKDAFATRGLTKIQLFAGVAGKGRVAVAGKKFALGPIALPMTQDPAVTVQLRNGIGHCWSTTHGTAKRNDAGVFTSKSD